MTQAEEKIWFTLVAEWRSALSRAFAAQVRLNDGVDASIDGADQFPPHGVSVTTENLWADETRKRYEMERFIDMHRVVVERGSMPDRVSILVSAQAEKRQYGHDDDDGADDINDLVHIPSFR